jgi:hypothetical protein
MLLFKNNIGNKKYNMEYISSFLSEGILSLKSLVEQRWFLSNTLMILFFALAVHNKINF